ncbi:unnamed protein product, partial [Timema podura]|nr:unnamed protein product [Timema podura]
MWSEALDEVFVQNYKSDPALSWQYFGTHSGVMRGFPGQHEFTHYCRKCLETLKWIEEQFHVSTEGFGGGPPMTYEEMAWEPGIPKYSVRQIYRMYYKEERSPHGGFRIFCQLSSEKYGNKLRRGYSHATIVRMRAISWRQDPDLFDCRSRNWYIEATTCSKDMVILMDISGSMRGLRHTIAKLTVSTLLSTLSNNDFFNVFFFNNETHEVVPCFKDMLVQATLENVNLFKEGITKMLPLSTTNFTTVMVTAFELLERVSVI